MSRLAALRLVFRVMRGRLGVLSAGAALSVLAALLAVSLAYATGGILARGLSGPGAGVLAAGAALGVLGAIRVVLRYGERLATHDAMFRALSDVRVWFFRGVAASAASGLGLRSAGDVLSRLVGDVGALDGLYLRIAVPVIVAVALVPMAVAAAALGGLSASLPLTILLAIGLLLIPRAVLRRALPGAAAETEAASALRVAITDTAQGLRDILAFSAGGAATRRMEAAQTRLMAAQDDAQGVTSVATTLAALCGQFAVLAVVIAACATATDATGTRRAVLVATVFLVVAAFESFAAVPRAAALAGPAAVAAERVTEAACAPVPYPDPPLPADPPPTGRFALQFEAVGFAYRTGMPVLDGLSLDLPRGARAAVLGPSGAGKSTLAALALRVVAPQSGRVLVDGTDIAGMAASSVRRRVTLLHQATHLFADTVRNNLALARPDATDAQLWAALEAARLADTVNGLPDKLDFWVAEGGGNLSGGQARRLVLARALLSPAELLILDEPASGLDAATERAFFETLAEATGGRTVLLIAHRLTGAEPVDRVFRLRAGRAMAATG